ncbi:PepSY-associated TM helix domain-containing protein [Chryseolinea lacunae]|uniref:PepSY domain-containing protein n=1 Tax=Chryseolinea lacunae TaxID=2801331 RepID=A0ABS1KVM2_9BACT|nr:PepSY-associated TM helix domain-containing protein [Chryseolinea lacunae]MBL0743519.1 PepSY domain-containing protein [Chryseolinea lacunae]
MKKAIGKIHLWLGLLSGLVVFIISVTGCIYVFEDEIKALVYHDRETISISADGIRKPLSELLQRAEQAAGEGHPIQSIEVPAAADHAYTFRPLQIRNKKAKTYFGEVVYNRKLYVNPYTGDIVHNENTKYEFFSIVLRIHRNLLLNRAIGSVIVGSAVLMFVILLISGIVLWWPKKGTVKRSFSFPWKSTTRWKRKNYDLHNVLGFYSLFILLAIALTGLVWSFEWFDHGVQWMANGGTKYKKPKTLFSDSTAAATTTIDKIYAEVLAENPDADFITISLPEKTNGAINALARYGTRTRYFSQRYQFDRFSGRLLKSEPFDEKNAGEKLRAMNYDIHTGAILGLPGKLLAFFASFTSASLPITGFLIWYGRLNKKSANNKEVVARPVANVARPRKALRPQPARRGTS